MCMYVCMYVYMYICIYVCTYVCMYVCMCVCVCACVFLFMYVCLYLRRYICMHVWMYICIYLTCVNVCVIPLNRSHFLINFFPLFILLYCTSDGMLCTWFGRVVEERVFLRWLWQICLGRHILAGSRRPGESHSVRLIVCLCVSQHVPLSLKFCQRGSQSASRYVSLFVG